MDLSVDQIVDQLQSINKASLSNDDARVRILRASQALCSRLESPYEWVARTTWQEMKMFYEYDRRLKQDANRCHQFVAYAPTLNFCLKVADDIGLFKSLGHRTEKPKPVNELATSTSTSPELLERILRHLAASGVILEDECEPLYQATDISEALALPEGSSGIRHVTHVIAPLFQLAPAYFKSTGYAPPTDNRNTVFQHTMGKPGQKYFEWLHQPENKAVATNFNLRIKFNSQYRDSWMKIFPPDNLLQNDRNPDTPLIVDIGGSIGTDAIEFRRRYPDQPGRVVLQDLAAVIASARESNEELTNRKIECHEYDFFAPQPILGARIYYMGAVLHDWPDTEARSILRNTVLAMTKGYSKLLLNEIVIPRTGCHPHLSALDIVMMALFASKERTEDQWRELLEAEGLRLVAVHSIPSCLKSVLETELI